ncbi:MAG: hypothetical protein H0W53_10770 [Acidobacteria bacterium]|nr:hypothetical protein [Acidobacteriota bacterium]
MVAAIDAASGADPEDFAGDLESDVVTVVDGVSTIFGDVARVTFVLALKDPGPSASPLTPTPANAITVDRYRVRFIRSDGRNRAGVDVPYGFDGAFTATVFDQTQASFTLVRAQAKAEAPLAALATSLIVVSTIAEITFYGHDQTGREVITRGRVGVHFANWGDPE